jgi:hypothetical protein
MKTIVLHVGSGKTGSTSIQKALFSGKENNDSCIYYPTLLDHKNNRIFRFAFCKMRYATSDVRREFSDQPKKYEEYQRNITQSFLEQCRERLDVVISSEFLFMASSEEVAVINQFLKEAGFDNIHVVMYVRNPAKYYLSAAQQSIKNQHIIPQPQDFNYHIERCIGNWSSIDAASITIREFDRDVLFQNDVVSDFNRYLNELGYSTDLPVTESNNETMTVEAAMVLQEFQKAIYDAPSVTKEKRKEYYTRAIKFSNKKLSGTKPILKPEIEAYILENYKDAILRLRDEHGIFTDLEFLSCKEKFSGIVTSYTDVVVNYSIDKYLEVKKYL